MTVQIHPLLAIPSDTVAAAFRTVTSEVGGREKEGGRPGADRLYRNTITLTALGFFLLSMRRTKGRGEGKPEAVVVASHLLSAWIGLLRLFWVLSSGRLLAEKTDNGGFPLPVLARGEDGGAAQSIDRFLRLVRVSSDSQTLNSFLERGN